MIRTQCLAGGLALIATAGLIVSPALAQGFFPRQGRPFGGGQSVSPRFRPFAGQPAGRPVRPLVDSPAVALLRRLVVAGATTSFIAREGMIRADGPGAFHVVKTDPRRGIRREPANGRGMVTLDNFRQVFKFPMSGKGPVTIEDSRENGQMGAKVLDLARRLRNGSLRADIVGQDTIAGRPADIVQVSAPNTPGGTTRRFWIDRETGLRLRTEEADSTGKVLSGSYYLSLDLNPQFAADDFTPPQPGPAGIAEPSHGGGGGVAQVLNSKRFPTVDAAAAAGFPAATPRYVPNGYSLRQVDVTKNGAQIALRYYTGLTALSVIRVRDGMPPRLRPLLQPDGTATIPGPLGRPGLFAPGPGGSMYLLIGELPESELRRIAASLR
jgi:hypothetical protein